MWRSIGLIKQFMNWAASHLASGRCPGELCETEDFHRHWDKEVPDTGKDSFGQGHLPRGAGGDRGLTRQMTSLVMIGKLQAGWLKILPQEEVETVIKSDLGSAKWLSSGDGCIKDV